METPTSHTSTSPNKSATSIAAAPNYSYRKIGSIALPIVISSVVEQLVGMTDVAFLGRVGGELSEIYLGASALGGIFFIAVFMLILGFCAGAQILIGRRNGERNYADIGTVFHHSLGFLFLLSIGLFAATHWLAPPLLQVIISSDRVYEAAWTYLDWRMWGIFFSMIACLFRSYYVGTTRTSILKYNALVMVGSNIIFDYLLIFGHGGFPQMGIAGAALASVMASFFSMLFFVVYTIVRGDYRKYGLHRLPRFKIRLLGKMLNISTWMMVQHFLSLFTWFLFFIAIEHLGERELAVTNVLRAISGFTYMSLHAFAATASSLTSNLIGAQRQQDVLPMIRRSILLASALLIPVWVLISLFPEAVLSVFTDQATIISEGIAPLLVLGVSYFFQIPSLILFYSVSGTGNTRTALLIEVIALLIYCTFVYYIVFQLRCNLAVAWSSEVIYSFPILIMACFYMLRGNWHHKQL